MDGSILNTKKHVVYFQVAGKEIVVGTDNIDDLVSRQWFSELLGVQPQVRQAPVVQQFVPQPIAPPPQPAIDVAKLKEELKGSMDESIRSIVGDVLSDMRRQQENARRAEIMRREEEKLRREMEASQVEVEEPPRMESPVRQQAAPAQRPAPSFLDIKPNAMTPIQWEAMSREQQQQWLKFYNLTPA